CPRPGMIDTGLNGHHCPGCRPLKCSIGVSLKPADASECFYGFARRLDPSPSQRARREGMPAPPLLSGFVEINSSRLVLDSPLSYRVGPWPAILGWTSNLYSSIRSSRSSSVASLLLPRSTPPGVTSLSFCTPARRSPAMWWLLVQGKSFRVEDTTCFGLASSLAAHSRIAGRASASSRATAGQ